MHFESRYKIISLLPSKQNMVLCSGSDVLVLSFLFFHILILSDAGNSPAPHYMISDIAINCGYTGNSTALDGREWTGDAGLKFSPLLQAKGKSLSSKVVQELLPDDLIPYETTRISSTQFYYTLPVNPGQLFIRLHFHPALYHGFEKSDDFFSVKVGQFTFLSNFSASLTANALGVRYFVKEYCVSVEENQALTITFSASESSVSRQAYAFVNGIEIVSIPTGLYYTPAGDLGARVIGQNGRFYVDNGTALELVQRLNIGGNSILPVEDSGMFRRWSEDSHYLMESLVFPVNYATRMIRYTEVPTYVAPLEVYQTSWSTQANKQVNKMYKLTWKIPVDLGFGYLIRLHFCELDSRIKESGQREFKVLVNGEFAETNADVIKWSGGNGIPVYKDYILMIKGEKGKGKHYLLIAMQSKMKSTDGLLNGLEIFKLSNLENNLASPNPSYKSSTSWSRQFKESLSAFGRRNSTVTTVTIILVLVNIFVYHLQQICESKLLNTLFSFIEKTNHGEQRNIQSTSTEKLCRCFSLADIKSATENFSDKFIVGKGGYGKVYKGSIDGAKLVAIKRLSSSSKQGEREFLTEIETLSKLRHVHLVSLIGYCNDSHEMILVYDYMSQGTLADHLYKIKDKQCLTWEQRLKICIGAAHGLNYLHTGTKPGVIHRDVKDTNILLDEMFEAKIADFGLAKEESTSQLESGVETRVRGTFDYLDPEYLKTRKVTKKSDVYAFGIALLVVLCGRPVVDARLAEEQRNLVLWARVCIRKGKVDQIIDPSLMQQIPSESLKEFVTIAERCLHKKPKARPTIAQVVASLESALKQLQSSTNRSEETADVGWSDYNTQSLSDVAEESTDVGRTFNYETIQSVGSTKYGSAAEQFQSRDHLKGKNHHTSGHKPLWCWSFLSIDDNTCLRFSEDDIRAATNNFSKDLIIIEDHISKVYAGSIKIRRGFDTPIGKRVIIKQFTTMQTDFESIVEPMIKRLIELQHLHLVPLTGFCHQDDKFMTVYNQANGTLRDYLYGTEKDPLPWKRRLGICIDAAQGLEYLHSCLAAGEVIIHQEISPASIHVDENWVGKISNLEWAVMNPIIDLIKPPHFEYFDPEFENFAEYGSQNSDVYSFGLVLLEVLCGRRTYNSQREDNQKYLPDWVRLSIQEQNFHQVIDSHLIGKITATCLSGFLKIALSCLAADAMKRPSMSNVVQSLKVVSEMQDMAEATKQSMKCSDDFDFVLENIYSALLQCRDLLGTEEETDQLLDTEEDIAPPRASAFTNSFNSDYSSFASW